MKLVHNEVRIDEWDHVNAFLSRKEIVCCRSWKGDVMWLRPSSAFFFILAPSLYVVILKPKLSRFRWLFDVDI